LHLVGFVVAVFLIVGGKRVGGRVLGLGVWLFFGELWEVLGLGVGNYAFLEFLWEEGYYDLLIGNLELLVLSFVVSVIAIQWILYIFLYEIVFVLFGITFEW
jgi:hypothetical protein